MKTGKGDPVVWLNAEEEKGAMPCGCTLYQSYGEVGPAFVMCERHEMLDKHPSVVRFRDATRRLCSILKDMSERGLISESVLPDDSEAVLTALSECMATDLQWASKA